MATTIRNDNDIATYIKNIQTDLEQLKNAQYTGESSLVLYLTESGNTYDDTFTLPSSDIAEFDWFFFAENQSYPLYRAFVQVWVDSVSPANDYSGSPFVNYNTFRNDFYNIPGSLRTYVEIQNPFGVSKTMFVKFYYIASDTPIHYYFTRYYP